METICPKCGNHDTIYVRAGGPSADLPTCPACAEVVHDADCRLVGDGRPVDGGALVCRECAEQANGQTLKGKPTFVEWLPMPPERGYGREDYIDEAYCALCGLRTDFGPCPQGCPSEFERVCRCGCRQEVTQ